MYPQNFRKIADAFVYGVENISGQKLTVVANVDSRCEWRFGHSNIDHDVEIILSAGEENTFIRRVIR